MTPFHLVQFSPWPILSSASILMMPVGIVAWIVTKSDILIYFGVILTTIIAYSWWRDIVRESTYQGFHSSKVSSGIKMGVALFILSEILFFFAFFWAYFHSSLAPTTEIGGTWPPTGVVPLGTFQVPLLNTSVLLLSGVSITWTHHSIEEGKHKSALQGLLITIILGLYFLSLQYGEYMETSFSIADSVYGSSFFLATGFHGLHVAIGVTFLSVCFIRLLKLHFSKLHHNGFLAAAWYWHFVDVVWLFLYVSIYWWGS